MKNYCITNRPPGTYQSPPGEWNQISSIDDIDATEIRNCNFTLFFEADDEYVYHINKIIENRGMFHAEREYSNKCYFQSSKNAQLAIQKTATIVDESSFAEMNSGPGGSPTISGGQVVHSNICQALEQTKDIDGDYVEIGVFKGSSALTAMNYMQIAGIKRKAYLLDTFSGFDYPDAMISSDAIWKNTFTIGVDPDNHIKMLFDDFSKSLPNQDFELVKSNICIDDLPVEIDNIAVANIDVDMYDATLESLKKISKKLSVGGIIMCEDSTSTPACIGAFVAMENFLDTPPGQKFIKIHAVAQYFLIKMS